MLYLDFGVVRREGVEERGVLGHIDGRVSCFLVRQTGVTMTMPYSRRYGYPLDDAAQVACDEVRKFLEGEDGDKVSLANTSHRMLLSSARVAS